MILLFVTSAIILQRLLELRLAKRNMAWALSRGAREYGADHYVLFLYLHCLWIVSFNLEWFSLRPAIPPFWGAIAVLIVAAQFLRYWAIATLGKRWNTRILILQGVPKVSSGPYPYFRHPNYIAVIVEIWAVPLVIGAWYTALFFSVLNAMLLYYIRIPAEEKALKN